MNVQHYIVARLRNQFCHAKVKIHSLFIVAGVDVAVNNIKVVYVSKEMQQCPIALLSSYKIFCTAVNNSKY